MRFTLTASFLLSICVNAASACPLVDGLHDFNCNQTVRVVVAGDSVVYGLGDTENGNRGGYVKRLDNLLPQAVQVVGLGTSGIRSDELLRDFQSGAYRKRTRRTDILFIDVGRNDCRDNLPPLRTFRNIKRLVRWARKNIGTATQGPPFIVVTTQIPDRERRRQCLEEINRILIQRTSRKMPAYLRFDKLPDTILGSDGLHPTSAGYQRMAKKMRRFINRRLQTRIQEERPDSDSDGIYDFHENARFGTNPELADTDEDTLLDGAEVFTHSTDPLDDDSDDDSRNDGQEISDGTDPLIAD